MGTLVMATPGHFVPGVSPAIHVFLYACVHGVDARHKAGHDGE
jgi:hypothetical protein